MKIEDLTEGQRNRIGEMLRFFAATDRERIPGTDPDADTDGLMANYGESLSVDFGTIDDYPALGRATEFFPNRVLTHPDDGKIQVLEYKRIGREGAVELEDSEGLTFVVAVTEEFVQI